MENVLGVGFNGTDVFFIHDSGVDGIREDVMGFRRIREEYDRYRLSIGVYHPQVAINLNIGVKPYRYAENVRQIYARTQHKPQQQSTHHIIEEADEAL